MKLSTQQKIKSTGLIDAAKKIREAKNAADALSWFGQTQPVKKWVEACDDMLSTIDIFLAMLEEEDQE